MDGIRLDDKEITVMNLVHYFVTEKNYNPVIVHGINDEIWLENMESDYRIVRIVSRYIHNDEQLGFNRFRTKQIVKKLKIKTLTFKMSMLSIYVDLGENVKDFGHDEGGNLSIFVKKMQDITKYPHLLEVFPDIAEKTHHDERGLELLFKITDDINHANERKNTKMEKIFSSKKSIVTYVIIALCTIMFVITGGGYSTEKLLIFGANSGLLVKYGQIYRLVTCMFLHAGIMHFGLNMYSLYVVGPKVEDFFGKRKFLLIYFMSGISASLLSIGLNNNVIAVGASGAIFGLFGALVYFGYTYRGYIGSMVRSQIVPVVLYNLVIGFVIPGIDVWGHVGGLIGGIMAANMMGTIENKKINISGLCLTSLYFIFLAYLVFFR